MLRGTRLEVVDAHDLVVGAAGQVAAVGAEAHAVHGAGVVVQAGELPRLGVGGIVGVEDGISRPDANMSISCCRGQARAVGRDVAGVDLVVLLLARMAQPARTASGFAASSLTSSQQDASATSVTSTG